MAEKSFTQPQSRLENAEFLSPLQEAIANRLDELATDPKLNWGGFMLELGAKIRRGEKVPASRMIQDAIIGVGGDFRLTHAEIDVVKEKFLADED